MKGMSRTRRLKSELFLDADDDFLLQIKDLKESLVDFKLTKYEVIIEYGVRYNKFVFDHTVTVQDSQY